MAHVVVAGWIGSDNLGDELVFAGLRRHLAAAGATVTALSVDPAATTAAHGTPAIDPGRLPRRLDVDGDALILGGGGLIQDITSPFNLPVHLSRVTAATRAGWPVAAIGLGCSGLRRSWSRGLVRRALVEARPVTVRNAHSARVLTQAGLRSPIVTADLALALPPVDVPASDQVAVCLRPWHGSGGWLPASVRHRVRRPDQARVARIASALDQIAVSTGLGVRFVALDGTRDGPYSEMVADRMRNPASVVTPRLDTVLTEIGSCRGVVAMRYHGGIGAVLAARPVAMIGYDAKVDALVAESAGGVQGVAMDDEGALPGAFQRAMDHPESVAETRDLLRDRERGNRTAVEELLTRI